MIVRISNEAQYELPDSDVAQLNEFDNAAVAACDADDETRFAESFGALLRFVREHGTRVPDDDLHGSDVILPPSDVSLQEARSEFKGEGLIPG